MPIRARIAAGCDGARCSPYDTSPDDGVSSVASNGEQGRLAGAVGSEQREDFAGLAAQGHVA